ncbi:MAG: hypothetical protein JWN77_919 [Frankiales bacterium]|jgi:hypothetical protein|nr:hypothetical protein [Frankiales bacterium]
MRPTVRLALAVILTASTVAAASAAASAPAPRATSGIACDKGSLPERTQGRAPAADVETAGRPWALPSRVDPNIVAGSFIMSGLRVFDIRDPRRPVEVAYFNKPLRAGQGTDPYQAGAFAMSAPAYDPTSNDIWYSDGNSGLSVVRLTPGTGIRSFASRYVNPGS